MIPAGLIGIPLLGVCLLIGIRLIRKGIRGERIGTSPFCRACGYNLTGTVSSRCSECGTWLSDSNVVIGVWRIKSRALSIGLSLVILSAPALVMNHHWARIPIDIISHSPNLVLATFGKLGSRASVAKLAERAVANRIPRWQASIISPMAFPSIRRPLDDYDNWLVLLGWLEARYNLSKSRQEALFELAATVTMLHPEYACSGDWYSFSIFVGSPLPGFRMYWWLERIELDTIPPVSALNQCSSNSGRTGCYAGIELPRMATGRFELLVSIRMAVMRMDEGDIPPWQDPFPEDKLLWSKDEVIPNTIDIQRSWSKNTMGK